MNEDDECQQGDDTSKIVCRFQSNGINATSVTANFILQTEEIEVKLPEDLVYLVCDALPGGRTSDACINIQTMSTLQFKALLWVDSDPFWCVRDLILTPFICMNLLSYFGVPTVCISRGLGCTTSFLTVNGRLLSSRKIKIGG